MGKTNNTKQAFWIGIGSLFSFGFGIVSSMILSRYFNKEDYGTYKQVLYVYNTLLTVFTLGLPKAFSYFLPRVKLSEAKNTIKKITNLFFILGAIFSVILFVFSPFIAKILNNPDLEFALKIFAPVPFLMLPTMGLEGILATFKMTKFMAIYTIVTRMFMLICVATPIVFFNGGYTDAIYGFVAASIISFILALYFKFLPVRKEGNEKSHVTYKEIFQFSLPLLYASLWGILIKSADQFFISRFFGNKVFAEFSNGAMELPFVGMIVGATATVLSPIFSRMSHEKLNPKKEIFPIWKNVFEKSAMLIYPILIYCLFFADIIMIVLYGQKYEISAIYFKIKLILNFFNIIAFAPLLINIGKVKIYSNVIMIGSIALIIFEYLSVVIINSPFGIIITSVIINIIIVFIMLFYVAKFFSVKIYELFPYKIIIKTSLLSILISIFINLIILRFIQNEIWQLIVSFLVFTILYLTIAKVFKIDYIKIIKPLFQNR